MLENDAVEMVFFACKISSCMVFLFLDEECCRSEPDVKGVLFIRAFIVEFKGRKLLGFVSDWGD